MQEMMNPNIKVLRKKTVPHILGLCHKIFTMDNRPGMSLKFTWCMGRV